MKRGRLRVFLDANVVFTAAYNPLGLARLLFELERLSVLSLLGSEHVLEEARTNLSLKKPAALDEFALIEKVIGVVDIPARHSVALDLPEDDVQVFAAAVAGRATHLLTGDKKHFGALFNKPEETSGICIQTVRQFYDERF